MTTMADHGDSPFSAAIDDPGPACTLQALAVRVSQLGVRVENMFKLFETKFHYFTTRLHTFEQRHAVFRAEIDRNSLPRAKRIKVDDFKISISENEMNLMHSSLTGPVKDAIHELGRAALSDQDVALRFLRIGSDKSVALATLHSKELQRKRDSINWSFLSVDSIQVLEQRFVKTIAKKVEHTKRKIRQHSSENLLAAAKYGKDGQPFVELLLQWLLKRHDVCHVETASSSMSESNISSTTATSTSDLSLEIKMISANDSAKRELMIPL